MKRGVWRWLVALALAVGLALPASVADAAQQASPLYLALGDSLAAGVGATSGVGYVPRLRDLLRQSAQGGIVHLANVAVRGETSDSFIAGGQLGRALDAIDDPATEPRVVTLDIGGNDVLGLLAPGGPCATAPAGSGCQAAVIAGLGNLARNYPALLSALSAVLAARDGHARLLVMTYYNPFSGTGSPYEALTDRALLGSDGKIDCAANASDPQTVGLNDLIACLGSRAGATVVDVYPLFAGKGPVLTHILSGDVHPNDQGHEVIARALAAALANGARP